MNLKKKYGFLSMLSSIICLILLIASYVVAPETPQGIVIIGIQLIFFMGIIFLVLGIFGSTIAMKQKEKGVKNMLVSYCQF
ncbi:MULTISPECIES: hypothetical protein [Oceanobacillus]|uniref:hypothetical protein n=1 Tax=Oceanobacillus TaxID=182709 RepID=UPI0021169AF6|nr:hypothetical protein [Oceanobacillus oncorhynchi]UUI41828.1 hypothetical protein NP440_10015 [Oceanobacillus oncorhynchi]